MHPTWPGQDPIASLLRGTSVSLGESRSATGSRSRQILQGESARRLPWVLARSPTYGSLAEVANLIGNVDAFVGTMTEVGVSGRQYDGGMTEIAAPARKPLSGPTGQRVAARRGELLEVLRRHGVTNPEIFGSAARGDDREDSDLDLLVDFAPGTDIIDIIGIKRELEDVLGVPVDLVPRSGLKERVRSRAATDLLPL